MNIYTIKYNEVYSKEYEIEAEDEEQAKEKLVDVLYSGKINPPVDCEDSYSEILKVRKLIRVVVGNNMYRKEYYANVDTSLIELFVKSGIAPYRKTNGFVLSLNGVVIQKEDLFKSLSEFDIDSEAYLLAIPIAQNV